MKRCYVCNYRARSFDRLEPDGRQYRCNDENTAKCKARAKTRREAPPKPIKHAHHDQVGPDLTV